MKEWVVEFKLPTDKHLLVRHATNVTATTAEKAIAKLGKFLPMAYGFSAWEGLVLLYGRKWVDYDEMESARLKEIDDWAKGFKGT